MFEFPQDIVAGKYDDELTAIREALAIRTEALSAAKTATLKYTLNKDDIVQIPHGSAIRPKYLHGVPLRVVRVLQKNVSVMPEPGHDVGKWSRGFKLPMSSVEVVNTNG